MITEIGITAGEIWHFLDENGESSLGSMITGIDRERDLILMSLGWLGREGHVLLKQRGSDYTVSLRRH